MIEWIDFEKHFYKNSYYKIDNGCLETIVLFGNCQMAPIGFFLNYIFQNKYNIIIILSWFFDKYNFEHEFNMNKINNDIQNAIYYSSFFIYHKHCNDYLVNASNIDSYVSNYTKVFQIPNLQLYYNSPSPKIVEDSILKLSNNISDSDFKEFSFIVNNMRSIIFFNTPEHPTHYLLFMLAKAIYFKIEMPQIVVDISMYFNEENRKHFNHMYNFVLLPGHVKLTDEMKKVTGISKNADYFDVLF